MVYVRGSRNLDPWWHEQETSAQDLSFLFCACLELPQLAYFQTQFFRQDSIRSIRRTKGVRPRQHGLPWCPQLTDDSDGDDGPRAGAEVLLHLVFPDSVSLCTARCLFKASG
jgi:hypothetical protein